MELSKNEIKALKKIRKEVTEVGLAVLIDTGHKIHDEKKVKEMIFLEYLDGNFNHLEVEMIADYVFDTDLSSNLRKKKLITEL